MGEGPTTMGCGSGKDTQTETTCTSSGPSSNPLFITVQNKWNDGQTKEQVVKALKDMGEKAMTVDGVRAFQYGINEEKKMNIVTEIYDDASVIGKFFQAVGETTLPPLIKAITTTSTIVMGPKDQVDLAAPALKDFSPQLYYTDLCGTCCHLPEKSAGAFPLVMTVQNKWNDGQTKEQVVKALKDMGEKAMTVDGVRAFQYAINEETKTNQVTEIYDDASVIGKFFQAV